MILPHLSFSQSGYPKVVIINGDTLIAVTKQQLKDINIVKVERDYYEEYSDSLNVALELTSIALIDCRELNEHLEKEVEVNGKLNKHQRSFIQELREDLKGKEIKINELITINRYLWGYSIAITIVLALLLL